MVNSDMARLEMLGYEPFWGRLHLVFISDRNYNDVIEKRYSKNGDYRTYYFFLEMV